METKEEAINKLSLDYNEMNQKYLNKEISDEDFMCIATILFKAINFIETGL